MIKTDEVIPANTRGFICLQAMGDLELEETFLVQEKIFQIAQKLSAEFSTHESLFVNVIQNDDPKQFALCGGLWGLCKTARQEWDKTLVKCIALPTQNKSATKLAQTIYDEILFGGSETEIVISKENKRKTFLAIPKERDLSHGISLNTEDILVVTGGARGITAKSIIELAKQNPCRFLILGRTPLIKEEQTSHLESGQLRKLLLSTEKFSNPRELEKRISDIINSREVQSTLDSLKALNCEIRYECLDCTKAEDLHHALKKAREHWKHAISGIIHGAGVIHDRLLGDIATEHYHNVFNTKVKSALNLLSETKRDSLKFICFFSSIAARWGNRGQSVYAMANEALNKLALYEAERRHNCIVKSIDWGPWQGGMVNEHLAKIFTERKVGLLDINEGAQSFAEEFFDTHDTEVVLAQKPLTPLLFAKIPSSYLDWNLAAKELFLEDHTIKSSRVVPFAAVLEWTLRIASSHRPDLKAIRLAECACYKGIQIPDDFSAQSLSIKTNIVKSDSDTCTLAVKFSIENRSYYRITVEMSNIVNASSQIPILKKYNHWTGPIYDGDVLFHGPQFQTLKEVHALNEDGAESTIDMSFSDLCNRMLLLDSGIQLAVLWMWKILEAGALPSSIASVRFFKKNFPKRIQVSLRGRLANSTSGLIDLYFRSEEGEDLARVEGLLMTSYFSKPFFEVQTPKLSDYRDIL